MKQYTLLTANGINKLLKTASDGSKIALKEIVVSDYDGELSEQTTSIPNEKYRGAINAVTIDENDNNILDVDAIIPPEVGGFYIKTAGIYCDDGSLFAAARLADTYKPLLNEGSSKDITLNFKLQIANANDSIVLKVDNNVVLATRKWSDATFLKKTDASSFIQTTQRTLISEYAHVTHSQILPDGDYSSSDFWLSVKPGIYYAVREKGRNKPVTYGLVEIISNGEVSVTWSYFGEVWKWYQGFNKSNSGWKKVVTTDNYNHKIPVGSYILYSSNSNTPDGFLRCDGSALDKNTYAALFAVIGYTYGRSGDKFLLPNFSDGKFMRSIGGNAAALGTAQGDAIRNIKGSTGYGYGSAFREAGGATGAFTGINEDTIGHQWHFSAHAPNNYQDVVSFDASKVVPTANENRPYNMAVVVLIKY